MDEILLNLAVEAPSSAVAIYALWRMSIVMVKLSDAITAISTQNSESIAEMVDKGVKRASIKDNGRVLQPIDR